MITPQGIKKCVEFWLVSLKMLWFMSQLASRIPPDRPGSRVWWVRVAVTAVFLIWVNAVAIHLQTEPHLEITSHHHPTSTSDCERGLMHSHDRGCHSPHTVSDHGYFLAVRILGSLLPPALPGNTA